MNFSEEFDAVLFYASLHHTTDLDSSLRNAFNALKPGGILIAMEPGIGHKSASAGMIDKFDLGDHDMPPWMVIKSGKKVGFKFSRIYQHPAQLHSCLYEGTPSGKIKKMLWKIPGFKVLALFCSILLLKKFNGVVCMNK